MPKLQRQGGVVLSPSHQRQFLSRSGLYQTLAYGCRTSPLGGAVLTFWDWRGWRIPRTHARIAPNMHHFCILAYNEVKEENAKI